MNFSALIQTIQQTHTALQQQAVKAINRSLTIRNWLMGYYIVEFEQNGEDRAKYGEKLLSKLAAELKDKKVSNIHERELRRYREFYLIYPQLAKAIHLINLPENIRGTLSPVLLKPIRGTASAELLPIDSQDLTIIQTPSAPSNELQLPPEKILNNLSFSHLTELIKIDDPVKRAYYELLAIKGNLSVRELKRQINTLSYERTGLAKEKEANFEKIIAQTTPQQPAEAVKDIYVFEFLELPDLSSIEEKDIETALLDHLQEFILELGHGFCFEARQQKILIGDEYFFIDLVFYHRILKCHILIELKVEEFNHANAGQLNTYLAYYKKEVAQPNDNPPVGILLVTNKNEALVEYATAGMDNQLFVSKYLVQLPSKEQLQQFIQKELRQL